VKKSVPLIKMLSN